MGYRRIGWKPSNTLWSDLDMEGLSYIGNIRIGQKPFEDSGQVWIFHGVAFKYCLS